MIDTKLDILLSQLDSCDDELQECDEIITNTNIKIENILQDREHLEYLIERQKNG